MTRRGFWFLASSGGALVLSLALPYQFSLTLFGLTGLTWCAIEWVLFQLRCDLSARKLVVVRKVNGQTPDRVVLWEGRPARVEIQIESKTWLGLPWIRVTDLQPTVCDARGTWFVEGPCGGAETLGIDYEIIPRLPGRIGFDGLRLEVSDGPGFFSRSITLRERVRIKVLPSLAPEYGMRAKRKRDNQIPSHGVHRHLKAGSGSELLNLRDYNLGDPPRRIAWKVSARRDRLITREQESEVPVRVWLVLDISDSVRVGWPGPTSLAQSIRIASALTRELIGQRDPVGLVTIEEDRARIIPPGVGPRHQTRLLTELCEVAGQPPKPSPCPPNSLIGPAEQLCRSRYTELFDQRINRRIWRLEWPWRRLLGWPLGVLLVLTALGVLVSHWWIADGVPFVGPIVASVAICFVIWAWWRVRGWRHGGFRGLRELRRRKQIASQIAIVKNLGVEGIARMMDSDAEFSRQMQRFLIDHRFPYSRPLHDSNGDYLFRDPSKIETAARVLLQAVAHGRDNEVFVLLFDLLEHEQLWDPFMEAVKVAKSRHHQVILLCPWPAELMIPAVGDRGGLGDGNRPKFHTAPRATAKDRWSERARVGVPTEPGDLHIQRLLSERYFRAFESAWQQLAKMGIQLLVANVQDTPREVLRRIEMVRSASIPSHH